MLGNFSGQDNGRVIFLIRTKSYGPNNPANALKNEGVFTSACNNVSRDSANVLAIKKPCNNEPNRIALYGNVFGTSSNRLAPSQQRRKLTLEYLL